MFYNKGKQRVQNEQFIFVFAKYFQFNVITKNCVNKKLLYKKKKRERAYNSSNIQKIIKF